jgi:hypothetical protein
LIRSNIEGETVTGIYDVYTTAAEAEADYSAAQSNFSSFSPPGSFRLLQLSPAVNAFCGPQAAPANTTTCWFNDAVTNGSVTLTAPPAYASDGPSVLQAMLSHVLTQTGPSGSSQQPTAQSSASAANLPVLAMQNWTGIEPASISYGGAHDYTDYALQWQSWGQYQAVATGLTNLNNCIPDCAAATITTVTVTIILSHPANGRYTVLTEVIHGSPPITNVYKYGDAWPTGT